MSLGRPSSSHLGSDTLHPSSRQCMAILSPLIHPPKNTNSFFLVPLVNNVRGGLHWKPLDIGGGADLSCVMCYELGVCHAPLEGRWILD